LLSSLSSSSSSHPPSLKSSPLTIMPTAYEIQRDQFVSQLQGHVSPILDNELDQFVSHLQGRVVIITGEDYAIPGICQ
jgi:hypothetical protein